jgi:hypothetical protein
MPHYIAIFRHWTSSGVHFSFRYQTDWYSGMKKKTPYYQSPNNRYTRVYLFLWHVFKFSLWTSVSCTLWGQNIECWCRREIQSGIITATLPSHLCGIMVISVPLIIDDESIGARPASPARWEVNYKLRRCLSFLRLTLLQTSNKQSWDPTSVLLFLLSHRKLT